MAGSEHLLFAANSESIPDRFGGARNMSPENLGSAEVYPDSSYL